MNKITTKAWIVSADMGYGHQRAVYPLSIVAEEKIFNAGKDDFVDKKEKKVWDRLQNTYEFFSRSKDIPYVGNKIFNVLNLLLKIPPTYPIKRMSSPSIQVKIIDHFIKRGLCKGIIEKVSTKPLPIVTSFYATAVAADYAGLSRIYCIICDADLNRAWVSKNPEESRIQYFVPCSQAAKRLVSYGVSKEKIHYTGFPLPLELTGKRDLDILKKNLKKRLLRLDPKRVFYNIHKPNIKHFLGDLENLEEKEPLTIMYSVGGAGAQKDIGIQILESLNDHIKSGKVRLLLAAGTKKDVRIFFEEKVNSIGSDNSNIKIIWGNSNQEYFKDFSSYLADTDVLWTKPSELSFYAALGLPIIMTKHIGAQEKANKEWLRSVQAGIKQEDPKYTHIWLLELLNKGRLAEAAWSGFLKAKKCGTFNIIEVLENGIMSSETSPLKY